MKSTTSRKSSNLAMINSSRAPPRPTPGLVNYSDEDSAKGYDENPDDSDSLTEKPSEISSTDSQVCTLIDELIVFMRDIQSIKNLLTFHWMFCSMFRNISILKLPIIIGVIFTGD